MLSITLRRNRKGIEYSVTDVIKALNFHFVNSIRVKCYLSVGKHVCFLKCSFDIILMVVPLPVPSANKVRRQFMPVPH